MHVVEVHASAAGRSKIVGTRNPKHVDEAITAADPELDARALGQIEDIVSDEVPVGGPSPETV